MEKEIKIKKYGHRLRFLTYLEEEANNFFEGRINPEKFEGYLTDTERSHRKSIEIESIKKKETIFEKEIINKKANCNCEVF